MCASNEIMQNASTLGIYKLKLTYDAPTPRARLFIVAIL